MAKGKDVQVRVTLECTCYIYYFKNWHNIPSRLELRKFYHYCFKHTIRGEIKR
ncbi:hypothetical protein ACOSP7_022007 [Xanthoceras sorbifolium]